MQVNRYTNIQPAKYNPRSLQELMMVPQYKRGQHDLLDEKRSALETSLGQIDPLDIHSEAARMEQQKLYDQMTQQAEKLSSQGFNPTSNSDFLRLNKQYQQAVSPTGTLGRIQSAKKSAEAEKADILANGVKMGYSPKAVQAQLDKSFKNYEEKFRQTGKVENFKGDLPPSYQDLDADIKDIKVMAGATVKTEKGNEGYNIITDPTTQQLVAITESGQVITKDNNEQLASGLEHLNSKWIDSKGEGYASAQYEGLNPEYISQRITSGLGMMKISETQDTRNKDYKFMANPAAQYGNNGNLRDFVSDKIKGFTNNSLAPGSPLRALDFVTGFEYNQDGSINTSGAKYTTYEDKVADFKKKFPGLVEFDKDRGIATYLNSSTRQIIDIPMDSNHMIGDLEDIRKNNPFVSQLSDKELISTLQSQKESLSSNFAESIDLIGSDYKWLNTRLFGDENHKTGMLFSKGAIVNGKELPADLAYEELGYSNASDFYTEGKPTTTGYSPASGTYTVSVTDNSGNPTTIAINAEPQLKSLTPRTQAISKALLNGESIVNLGGHSKDKDYSVYFVNNFTEDPYIVISKNKNASTISELLDDPKDRKYMSSDGFPRLKNSDDVITRFSNYSAIEKGNLISSNYFAKMSGIRDYKEKNK